MDIPEIDCPFVPGTGTWPPYLAGRKREKSKLEEALDWIMDKPDKQGRLVGVSPPLVLMGPRGVGKTVLLGWAKEKAEEQGVQCALLTEDILGGPVEDLAVTIMGEEGYKKAVREGSLNVGVNVGVAKAEGEIKMASAVFGLETIIRKQLEKGPLLLILDEAHAVAPELLKKFCVAVQNFILSRSPLAMVLAGTPGLRGLLRGHGASFMERSEIMTLNLLEKDETRTALSVPAKKFGKPMSEDALEALAEWTDCYPYFIQIAGRETWDVAKDRGGDEITLEDAKKALSVAEEKRQNFYNQRYVELVRQSVEQYAMQAIVLAEAEPDKSIEYKKLIVGVQEANKGMNRNEAVEAVQSLIDLGFIYEKNRMFEAGIPTLFDYVRNQEAT